jgi:hypothetical protein
LNFSHAHDHDRSIDNSRSNVQMSFGTRGMFGGFGARRSVGESSVMTDTAAFVVPVTFAGVDVLVQATPVEVVGAEPTSAATRVADAYGRAEAAILGVAESVAGTIDRLIDSGKSPKEVQVEFGLSVSLEGDVLVAKGKTEATLAVTLTYAVTH